MHPTGEAVFYGGRDGLIVSPSLEDGAWWESVHPTVIPSWLAKDVDNENWLCAVWWDVDNNSADIQIKVKNNDGDWSGQVL